MGDPKGFLAARRAPPPKRPAGERVRDHRYVYRPLPLAELRTQASRCMDCGVPFCSPGCPLHNLIPDWNDLVYRDRWREAIDRLHATNNFPEFTGTLCPAPCEDACVLAINDQAVTIKEIERSIVERAFDEGWVRARPPERRSGRRVAVVGSGPAGLAAAQQLNRAGHQVTVFERDDEIGGLLTYGIPDFKIEKWMVRRRVALLAEEGVELRTGVHVGEDLAVEELRAGFDAVLLAVGALAGRDLDVPGRELGGIHMAMDYLVQCNRRVAGRPVEGPAISARGRRVVILGGGDTGADCLGNAHREGCASVQVLTHGPRPPDRPDPLEWPDVPFVLRTWPAHEEGGGREFSVMVQGFTGSDGHVGRLRLVGAERTPEGLTRVVPGAERELEADLVLVAIGFSGPVRDRLLDELGVTYTPTGAIASAPGEPYAVAGAPGVFVAGDAMRGASLIVWAIADGRKAARAVDQHLMGASLLPA
ncbi:MAG TPA: glutamate synthase subunit beta [Actinomycetes bacterium]|nr:glutamate synthase subunit beta [Actinomycetes bacterium]